MPLRRRRLLPRRRAKIRAPRKFRLPVVPRRFAVQRRQDRLTKLEQLEARAVPRSQLLGTLPERILYKALTDRRIPFTFVSSLVHTEPFAGWFILINKPIDIDVITGASRRDIPALRWTDSRRAMRRIFGTKGGRTVYFLTDNIIYDDRSLQDWITRHLFGPVPRDPFLYSAAQLRG